MPPKDKRSRRARKAHSLKVKLEVLDRIARGEKNKDICLAMGLSKSTVCTILNNSEKITASAENIEDDKLTKVTRGRAEIYETLERLLVQWIDCHTDRGTPLSFLIIQEKAVSLFEDLKKKAVEEGVQNTADMEFKASKGWFDRFKKRAYLHNVKLRGEAASADSEAATSFPTHLQDIIDEGKYHPKQIFNMDETGLFWRRMPSRTYISVDESKVRGHKASKDRLTLLLGGNLEGDVKIKPLLVYHSENPRAMKGVPKSTLPVMWRSNRKAWVTRVVFSDYIRCYFAPFVSEYCKNNNLDNKVLLILDNAPGHPISNDDYPDNIRVVFLPPNTTPLLQPMDQGIISTFKAYYLQLLLKHLVHTSDASSEKSLMDVWKAFNIKMAVEFISTAWSMVSKKTMNAVWKRLCPKYAHDYTGFAEELPSLQEAIVDLATQAGFEDVKTEDVQEVLASHTELLTNEELIQLDEQRIAEKEEEANESEKTEKKTLDMANLKQMFELQDGLLSIIEKYDNNFERALKAKMMLKELMKPYKFLYEKKRREAKQSRIYDFFRRKPQDSISGPEPLPSTSGYVPPGKAVSIDKTIVVVEADVEEMETEPSDCPDSPTAVDWSSFYPSPPSPSQH